MIAPGCTSYSYTTQDGNETTTRYTIRGLLEEEIVAWSEFCAAQFAYKAHPPKADYFKRHYTNDPHRQASLIRVAFVEQEDNANTNCCMVASCRVFCRTLSIPATADSTPTSVTAATETRRGAEETSDATSATYHVKAGGIGEVCTHLNHRRRGLSKALLADCLDIMKTQLFQVSLLHAAPDFFPVYRASGYECSTSRWTRLSISRRDIPTMSSISTHTKNQKNTDNHSTTSWRIRRASFPQDTAVLQRLYREVSEQQQDFTTIVRSTEYWNDYLSAELGDTLWVTEKSVTRTTKTTTNEPNDEVVVPVGSLAVKVKAGVVGMTECTWDTNCANVDEILQVLLPKCLEQVFDNDDNDDGGDNKNNDIVELKIPTFIVDQVDWLCQQLTKVANDEHGWMFQDLRHSDTSTSGGSLLFQERPVLIWPADAF